MRLPEPYSRSPQLIVALDIPCVEKALLFVDALGDLVSFYKVGPVLFSQVGGGVVDALIRKKKKVFVDLKFYEIPSVVVRSCYEMAIRGASLITVHIACGKQAIEKSLQMLQRFPQSILLGVGVLTSLDKDDLGEMEIFATTDPLQLSAQLLLKGLQWGLPGVVCSAHNLQNLLAEYPHKITLVPGVRIKSLPLDAPYACDQKRISTLENFSPIAPTFVVVGRPILDAEDPIKTVSEITQALLKISVI